MKVSLPPQKKQELEQMYDSSSDAQVYDHIKAIPLSFEDCCSTMISQALHIHETTVLRHINDYLQSEKLKPENCGSQNRLSATQTCIFKLNEGIDK